MCLCFRSEDNSLSLLVVVLVVNYVRITLFEREGDAPVLVDTNAPSTLSLALELMQMESGSIHILRRSGYVEPREQDPQSRAVLGIDAGCRTGLEELAQSAVLKASYHTADRTT